MVGLTIRTETSLRSGFTRSKCALTVSTTHGSAVGQAHANGLNNSCITTTARDRINHSMDERQLEEVLN